MSETAAPATGAGTPARITFSASNLVAECPAGATVLEAARSVGLKIPYKCAKGVCGTCKSRLVSGTVDMRHGGGIRPKDIAAGLFLPCCSRPLEDLVVER